MARYVPEPTTELDLAWVMRELRRVGAATEIADAIILDQLHAPPERVQDGMVVLADGVNWDPGSGAGYYGRLASTNVLTLVRASLTLTGGTLSLVVA